LNYLWRRPGGAAGGDSFDGCPYRYILLHCHAWQSLKLQNLRWAQRVLSGAILLFLAGFVIFP
jgi:hypothetical protein